MSGNAPVCLGFDVGGTKCAVCAGRQENDTFRILGREVFPTAETRTPAATLERMGDLALALLDKLGIPRSAVAGGGISCGGPLDSRRGLVLSPPNLPGWDEVPAVEILQKKTGVPVRLENDANACALAEWRWGAGRGTMDMIFLTFGTGLGAGLVLNGQLCRGANDMAGEAGHIRLAENGPVGYHKAGSFEGFCSGGGMAQAAKLAGFPDGTDARRIFELAAAGDGKAGQLVEQTARMLGKGLSVLVDILNPECIVLGGLFVRQAAVLRPLMNEELQKESLGLSREVCRIVPAELGESIGDFGALAAAGVPAE